MTRLTLILSPQATTLLDRVAVRRDARQKYLAHLVHRQAERIKEAFRVLSDRLWRPNEVRAVCQLVDKCSGPGCPSDQIANAMANALRDSSRRTKLARLLHEISADAWEHRTNQVRSDADCPGLLLSSSTNPNERPSGWSFTWRGCHPACSRPRPRWRANTDDRRRAKDCDHSGVFTDAAGVTAYLDDAAEFDETLGKYTLEP